MVPQLVKGFRRLEPAGPPGVYLLVAAYRMGRAPYPGVGSHSGEKVFVLRVKSTRSLFKRLGLKMWEKKKHAHSDSSGIRARSGLYRIEVKSELERNRTGSGSDQDGIGTRSEPDGNRIEKTWVTLMGTRLKKNTIATSTLTKVTMVCRCLSAARLANRLPLYRMSRGITAIIQTRVTHSAVHGCNCVSRFQSQPERLESSI